ncbi:MAG: ADP-ribosylglycohydrolase family protein [Candidatus Sericytochromatia bacterium]
MDRRSRFHGALLGLAAGDAVGTTLEFQEPGSFTPITNMVGGGPFHLAPGEWTDDTSMALCLAESLIAKQGFDPVDQLERYTLWQEEGHLSSTGHCFDIGITVSGALTRFAKAHGPYCGLTDPAKAGNGSIMRLAPVPMAYCLRPEEAIARAVESSRTTHQAPTTLDACRYFGGLILGALQGEAKETLLADHYSPVPGLFGREPLGPEVAAIASGSFKRKQPPEIRGSGYVVESLEAALWAFERSTSFEEGCLMAANLGDDADTTAAVYGQLAGAYYGVEGIPAAWREKLALRTTLEGFADGLYDLAEFLAPTTTR